MNDIFDAPTEDAEAPEETTDTQPEEEAIPDKPEYTPEQIKEIGQLYLKSEGIDDFDPKKVRGLSQWEKDLNVKSSSLGNIAKALEEKPAEVKPTLDAETKAELTSALAEVLGSDPSEVAQTVREYKENSMAEREAAFSGFIDSHPDVSPEDLTKELMETGFNPNAPVSVIKTRMEKAYKAITVTDPEKREAEIRADERAKFLAEMADKGVKPEEVTEVKKGRGGAAGAHRNIDDVLADSSVSMFDKMAALQDG
jgi:hypothetical protein